MSQPVYAIGDVQGCGSCLNELLAKLPRDANAQLWFAGDLINRGSESLQVLRTVMDLGDRAVCVLGNHDLHFLAVAAGIRDPGRNDTIQEILDAPDRDELIHWLRHRPLAYANDRFLLVHAGVHPQWTLAQALDNAAQVETALRSTDWRQFLGEMYGNNPKQWSDSLRGSERLRATVNILTRMRMLDDHLNLNLKYKLSPDQAPTELLPWYAMPMQLTKRITVVFGHWSTLGLMFSERAIGLDTGCVWGGQLTAVRLADRAVFQVQCSAPAVPASD